MKRLHPTTWLLFLCALLLAACAQMGLSAPETFNQKLLAGYGSVLTIARTAGQMHDAGKLSEADKDAVVNTNRAAIAALDAAREIGKTNPQAGTERMAATLAALTALQAYLATKDKP